MNEKHEGAGRVALQSGKQVMVSGGKNPNNAVVEILDGINSEWQRIADYPHATSMVTSDENTCLLEHMDAHGV